jgi:FMN phosphatase YigB (HAD superfamily)
MKKQGAILFDLDHTLIDTDKIRREWETVFARFGVSKEDAHSMARKMAGGTTAFHPVRPLSLIADRLSRREARMLLGAMHQTHKEGKYDFEGAYELLAALGEKHKLVLVSFGRKWYQMEKFKQTAFKNLFDEIVITSTVQKYRALTSLKKKYGKVVFVDDAHAAIVIAKQVGIPAVWVRKGKKGKEYYRQLRPRIEKAF